MDASVRKTLIVPPPVIFASVMPSSVNFFFKSCEIKSILDSIALFLSTLKIRCIPPFKSSPSFILLCGIILFSPPGSFPENDGMVMRIATNVTRVMTIIRHFSCFISASRL